MQCCAYQTTSPASSPCTFFLLARPSRLPPQNPRALPRTGTAAVSRACWRSTVQQALRTTNDKGRARTSYWARAQRTCATLRAREGGRKSISFPLWQSVCAVLSICSCSPRASETHLCGRRCAASFTSDHHPHHTPQSKVSWCWPSAPQLLHHGALQRMARKGRRFSSATTVSSLVAAI